MIFLEKRRKWLFVYFFPFLDWGKWLLYLKVDGKETI